jgi:Fe-S-cluster formation regulator IscX/YfhJ
MNPWKVRIMPRTFRSPSASSSLHLSPSELRQMLTPDNVIEITELLYDYPTLYAHLLHFTSIHRTIKRLEETFDDMKNRGLDDALIFFVARQRREQSVSQPPYAQRRPQPRSDSPHPRRRYVHRPPTPFSSPLGTRQNPIDVDDQDSSLLYFTAVEDSLPSYSPAPSISYGRQPSAGSSTPHCTYCSGRHTLTQCTRRNESIVLPTGFRVTPSGHLTSSPTFRHAPLLQ